MTQTIRIAVIQHAAGESRDANIARAGELIAEAAKQGANIALLPELFCSQYFPREPSDEHFALAEPADNCAAIQAMRVLARTHSMIIPVSFFERACDAYYNSVAIVDERGEVLGIYRKSHIPDGPGYEEKRYFAEGDTGFKAWRTHAGVLGVGICWDQWFPEAARAMSLLGAEVLMYPSTIGSEPVQSHVDTRNAWRRVMIGHAVANSAVLAASNRVGDEGGQVYYGSSFICDPQGELLAELGRDEEGVATAEIDLDAVRKHREWFGVFGDRRPDLYGKLTEPR